MSATMCVCPCVLYTIDGWSSMCSALAMHGNPFLNLITMAVSPVAHVIRSTFTDVPLARWLPQHVWLCCHGSFDVNCLRLKRVIPRENASFGFTSGASLTVHTWNNSWFYLWGYFQSCVSDHDLQLKEVHYSNFECAFSYRSPWKLFK